MYYLMEFSLKHIDHNLKIGGDEWNTGHNEDYEVLPTYKYKRWDNKYSKIDFEHFYKKKVK